jgi:transcriptional regulator with XRE-family HTH domain
MARRAARAEAVAKLLVQAFGANLRVAREESGLSQTAVAAQTGIPQSRISEIESGKHFIGVRAMSRLAVVVGGESLSVADAAKFVVSLLQTD